MLEGKVVKQFPQMRDGHSATARKGVLVHLDGEGKDAGITAHQGVQEVGHTRIRQVDIVKCIPLDYDHHTRIDVHILAESKMVLALEVFDGIMHGCAVESVFLGESLRIELELPAYARVIRYAEEHMQFLINILDELHGWE